MSQTLTPQDCAFFHTIDLPNGERVTGMWDFRETEAEYIGRYPIAGKSVLEIGTASGSHAFWMEKQGARVTAMDLSPELAWDVLLTAVQDPRETDRAMREGIRKINNGWRYCRDRLGSKLDLTHGSIYDIPKALGDFDIVTYGSVLLHTRDPIGALQHGAGRAREAVIITDRAASHLDPKQPLMEFMPKLGNEKPWGGWTWWWITPQVFINVLTILGFKNFELTTTPHLYELTGKKIDLFTLVATR